jgi:hypothetical protein
MEEIEKWFYPGIVNGTLNPNNIYHVSKRDTQFMMSFEIFKEFKSHFHDDALVFLDIYGIVNNNIILRSSLGLECIDHIDYIIRERLLRADEVITVYYNYISEYYDA